jgi:hypothetical protein
MKWKISVNLVELRQAGELRLGNARREMGRDEGIGVGWVANNKDLLFGGRVLGRGQC